MIVDKRSQLHWVMLSAIVAQSHRSNQKVRARRCKLHTVSQHDMCCTDKHSSFFMIIAGSFRISLLTEGGYPKVWESILAVNDTLGGNLVG